MSEDKTPYGIASQIEAISVLIHSEVDTMDIPAIMEKINQLTMYTANAAQLLLRYSRKRPATWQMQS